MAVIDRASEMVRLAELTAYSDEWVTLFRARASELLASIDNADLAVIDPPYGDTSLEWDQLAVDWLEPVSHAVKPNGWLILWGSLRYLFTAGPAVLDRGWRYSQDIVWEKHNGSGSHADRFRRVHEHAVLFYRGDWDDTYRDPQFSLDATPRAVRRKQRPAHWGEIGEHAYRSEDGGPRHMRSVMYERSSHGEAIHPTQKPVGVLRTLIQYACPPGGLVVDPYAGSGSTLVAARSCGRRALGCDLDRTYVDAATSRLSILELPIAGANHDDC